MLITIAIPTYNNASYIDKAINSALNQNGILDYEVLIINNGSTDNTREILEKYTDNPKIRTKEYANTVDLFLNHNRCFNDALGDYVLFCHTDDELMPNALQILEEVLKKRNYPQRYIVWGRSLFRDFFDNWSKAGIPLNNILAGVIGLRAFSYGGLTPSGTCYSRLSLLEIGGFYSMKSNITPCDLTILIKACLNGFEFEMIDRLILKRTFATNAKDLSFNVVMSSSIEALDTLFEDIDDNQKRSVIDCIYSHGALFLYPAIKRYLTPKRRLKYLLTRMIKSPLSIVPIIKVAYFKNKQ